MREANLHETIFDAVVAPIESQGLLAHEGTMVDATIIEAPRGRTRDDGSTTRDQNASYTRKHGKTYHGSKGHIACDLSKIATDYRLGTAKEHDSKRIDERTENQETAVIADSAYSSEERPMRLRKRGVIDGVIYKRNRGQAQLADWQVRWNQLVSRLRARVEHPFAMMKEPLGSRRVRSRGMARNEFDFARTMTACNLKQSLSLRPT